MRHQPNHAKHEHRRKHGAEYRENREFRGDRKPSPLPTRDTLIRVFDSACRELGAEKLTFEVRRGDLIRATVDRVNGALDTEFLISLIRTFRDGLRDLGHDPTDLDIEFDSPGENRELRGAAHWERFKGQRVRIEWKAPGPSSKATLLGVNDGWPLVRGEDGAEIRVDPETMRTMRLLPNP